MIEQEYGSRSDTFRKQRADKRVERPDAPEVMWNFTQHAVCAIDPVNNSKRVKTRHQLLALLIAGRSTQFHKRASPSVLRDSPMYSGPKYCTCSLCYRYFVVSTFNSRGDTQVSSLSLYRLRSRRRVWITRRARKPGPDNRFDYARPDPATQSGIARDPPCAFARRACMFDGTEEHGLF